MNSRTCLPHVRMTRQGAMRDVVRIKANAICLPFSSGIVGSTLKLSAEAAVWQAELASRMLPGLRGKLVCFIASNRTTCAWSEVDFVGSSH